MEGVVVNVAEYSPGAQQRIVGFVEVDTQSVDQARRGGRRG